MNIKDLKESLDYLFKAELTPFIWGHAGIGKTSAVKQYAQDKGYHFHAFYLGTQSDLGDILGLADFVKDEAGNSIATRFAPPEWLQNTIKYCQENPDSGAVVFLDEFNRAPRIILNGMFSFALDKSFNTIQLPKNCHIIAAGNPPTEEYVTTDVDETALMARFAHIQLEPTASEWLKYAESTGVDITLLGWLKEQPQLLFEKRSHFELPVKPDPRGIVRFDKLLKLATPQHLLVELGYGIIGVERMTAYQAYLKSADRPLTAEEILTGEKHELLKKWCDAEIIMTSYINLSCDNLKEHIFALDAKDVKLTDSEKKHLMIFIKQIPKDLIFSFVRTLVLNYSATFKDFTNGDKKAREFILDIVNKTKPEQKTP